MSDALATLGLVYRTVGEKLGGEAFATSSAKLAKKAAKLRREGDRLLKEAEERSQPTSYAAHVVKASDEQRFALLTVYSPNRMPLRGADKKLDVVSPEVLEKACWKFTLNGLKTGEDHEPGGGTAARVVENFVHRGPPWHVVGPDGREEVVQAGDWLVGLLFSPAGWEDFKAGRWSGVSLQGTAKRKPATAETLMRQRK